MTIKVPYAFTFTFDSSGSPDVITLPSDFPGGLHTLVLEPPVGHAWTYYDPSGTAYPRSMDQPVEITLYFVPSMTIGSAAMDSGSGTGHGFVKA
jgi:hypothetical protein